MTSALLAALALVSAAAVAGLLWRGVDGRRRRGSGALLRPADLALPADAFGARATLVQFSTASCARCPAARRVLLAAAGSHAGVRHAEVDLTERADLASRHRVLQTPTVLVLDERGAVATRIAGAPRPADLDAALADVLRLDPRAPA